MIQLESPAVLNIPQGDIPFEPSAAGYTYIELNSDQLASIADSDFILNEYNRGGWNEYLGNYIAVVDKIYRGHSHDPGELRAKVSKELNIPKDRVAVEYLPTADDN